MKYVKRFTELYKQTCENILPTLVNIRTHNYLSKVIIITYLVTRACLGNVSSLRSDHQMKWFFNHLIWFIIEHNRWPSKALRSRSPYSQFNRTNQYKHKTNRTHHNIWSVILFNSQNSHFYLPRYCSSQQHIYKGGYSFNWIIIDIIAKL